MNIPDKAAAFTFVIAGEMNIPDQAAAFTAVNL